MDTHRGLDVEHLAHAFVTMADTLAEDFDLIEFLYALVDRCVSLLDVSAVGLMLAGTDGRLQVLASSSEETRLLELFQLQNDQGPCLECYRTGLPVREDHLATATARWPRFAPEAVHAGFRSVHALPMRLRADTLGALNLFHAEPAAISHTDVVLAQALVDVAAIGLIQVEATRSRQILITQLETALHTRVVIEQAKGFLAERRQISTAEAFAALRSHARNHNIRLTDLAHAVVDSTPLAAGLLADPAGPAPTEP